MICMFLFDKIQSIHTSKEGYSEILACNLKSLFIRADSFAGCAAIIQLPARRTISAPRRRNLPTTKKVAGTSDYAVITMQKNFNKRGVKVITIGSDYLISIPSGALFADQSPRIRWESYALLNQVVLFLKQFRKVGVNVTSYSSQYVSSRREQALTLARARVVANYLWSQGIDSRFIFTEGAGSDKPVVSFYQGGDKSPNSRIEITFRDAIV